jgi:hypothetical protein
MHRSVIVWICANDTLPANERPVLITLANTWVVTIGQYRPNQWTCHGEPANVAYWADFPIAPASNEGSNAHT